MVWLTTCRASEAAVAAAVREEKRQAAERKAQRRARTRLVGVGECKGACCWAPCATRSA